MVRFQMLLKSRTTDKLMASSEMILVLVERKVVWISYCLLIKVG